VGAKSSKTHGKGVEKLRWRGQVCLELRKLVGIIGLHLWTWQPQFIA